MPIEREQLRYAPPALRTQHYYWRRMSFVINTGDFRVVLAPPIAKEVAKLEGSTSVVGRGQKDVVRFLDAGMPWWRETVLLVEELFDRENDMWREITFQYRKDKCQAHSLRHIPSETLAAAKPDNQPLPVESLADAMQDSVHMECDGVRAAVSFKPDTDLDLDDVAATSQKAKAELEELRADAERWRWLVRHASLGFDGAPSWKAVIRLPVFDSDDQTITALVDRALASVGD